MTLHAFDIPDAPARLSAWLEGHIHGLDLARLVAELTAVHGTEEPPGADLDQVLGAQKLTVLSEGLAALPPETLCQLLVCPRLLLELQELVLCEGGPYWNTIAADADHVAHLEHGAERLQTFLAAQTAPFRRDLEHPQRWYRRPWFVSLATAASVLIVLLLYDQLWRRQPDRSDRPPTELGSVAWGWNKPDALAADVSRSEYLNRLADEAGEWFAQRPTDGPGLARRIHEFRAGCSLLIFVEHQPLPRADRQWLIENCRTWGRKLDKQLAALESGQNALEVRDETDVLIHRMIDELREQAKKIA